MASSSFFIVAGGLSGAIAVGLGAYGAHGMKNLNNEFKEIWKTASLHHLVHTCALAGSAMTLQGRKQLLCCGFFLLGIILFSGSCYTVALKENRKYGIAAPYGGISFILGWLAFALL